MRIALVATNNTFGGGEQYLCALGSGLKDLGNCEIGMFATNATVLLKPQERCDFCEPVQIASTRLLDTYDLVHVNCSVPSARMCSHLRAPSVATFHVAPQGWRRIRARLLANTFASYKQIVCIGPDALVQWQSLARFPGVVVPLGIMPVRCQEGAVQDGVIVCPARLANRQKGQDLLLRSITLLRTVYRKQLRVRLLGDGPSRGALVALARRLDIADLVEFCGYQRDALREICVAHVMALPSRYEGVPAVCMEARAMGVPVVCADLPGTREALGDWPGASYVRHGRAFVQRFSKELLRALSMDRTLIRCSPVRSHVEMAHGMYDVYCRVLRGRVVQGGGLPSV